MLAGVMSVHGLLWEINDKDSDGNVIVGDIFSHETKNSFIYAESGIVATVGVENLVVVQTKDAVLVSERNKVQDVKKIVEQIKNSGRSEHYVHRKYIVLGVNMIPLTQGALSGQTYNSKSW